MGLVAEKFLENDRSVLGVMPSFLKDREVDHPSLTKFIETESMHERKQIMYDQADAFLVLPGGYGTLDELFETACWSQLDRHKKPVCVFNPEGFMPTFDGMIESMLSEGLFRKSDREIIKIESESFKGFQSLRNLVFTLCFPAAEIDKISLIAYTSGRFDTVFQI